MDQQQFSRAETKGQHQGADLHQPLGREPVSLLKLIAWPAAVFAFGFVTMGLHLLQLGGWL